MLTTRLPPLACASLNLWWHKILHLNLAELCYGKKVLWYSFQKAVAEFDGAHVDDDDILGRCFGISGVIKVGAVDDAD